MRQLSTLIIFITLATVAGQSAAQFRDDIEVYEKQDEEGVPSYSDVPSQGARPVIIPPTNPADPVQVRPPAPAPADPETQQAGPEPGTPEYEQKIQRELEEYRQRERETRRERQGGARNKVGTGSSTQRR